MRLFFFLETALHLHPLWSVREFFSKNDFFNYPNLLYNGHVAELVDALL